MMLHVRLKKKQTGFSLIELMIGMVLGLVVVGGAISMYAATIRGSTDTVNSARLNYDLDSVMQLMVNDIRRDGYWGDAVVGSIATDNPFTTGATDIQISNKTGEAANSCILYAYDANADGVVDLEEYYGFRLNDSGVDMRFARGAGASTCNLGTWGPIIDTNNVDVTVLTFSNANYKCLNVTQGNAYDLSCAAVITAGNLSSTETAVETRRIDINLQGTVDGDAAVDKELDGIVKVRNERIFIQP